MGNLPSLQYAFKGESTDAIAQSEFNLPTKPNVPFCFLCIHDPATRRPFSLQLGHVARIQPDEKRGKYLTHNVKVILTLFAKTSSLEALFLHHSTLCWGPSVSHQSHVPIITKEVKHFNQIKPFTIFYSPIMEVGLRTWRNQGRLVSAHYSCQARRMQA